MARRASRPAAPSGSAYDAAVRYLGGRNRSVAEIRRHLRGKRFDDTVIDAAIDKLRAQRYVDDGAFARYWVEQRDQFRPRGDRALTSELLRKGVARETIEIALGERSPGAEVERARQAISRPITRWQTLEPAERKRKIHAFLAARGFDYDVIEEVIARPEADPD
jgi:regulatory protein